MGNSGSVDAAELVRLAQQVEQLGPTESEAAAVKLRQLTDAVRAAREWHDHSERARALRLPAWADDLDRQLADLSLRMLSGHVKGVSGLERRIRQFLLALGLPTERTETGTAPAAPN